VRIAHLASCQRCATRAFSVHDLVHFARACAQLRSLAIKNNCSTVCLPESRPSCIRIRIRIRIRIPRLPDCDGLNCLAHERIVRAPCTRGSARHRNTKATLHALGTVDGSGVLRQVLTAKQANHRCSHTATNQAEHDGRPARKCAAMRYCTK
jgi:hypothetical protein